VRLGYSGGGALTVGGVLSIPLADLKNAHEAWLPDYMSSGVA
jgi:phosphoribosylformylglycinamidine synthase subunit PurL